MSADRIRVAVLFGGESPEHEVSLQSAQNVIAALDPDRYEPVLIGIDRAGAWHLADPARFVLDASDPRSIHLPPAEEVLALAPGRRAELVTARTGDPLPDIDVVFPVLHGPMGEDGTVQGMLRLAHLPFVGPDVLGSSIGMDKDVAKRLLRDAGITVAPFLTQWSAGSRVSWSDAAAELGSPLFVKPANMGSSVGVSKVASEVEFERALDAAFSFDTKVLLERAVTGRELECAVLGNEHPEASVPGEVAPRHEFYSYEAKYLDDEGADLRIPAELDPEVTARVRELSIRVFETLCCEGMARVDFFLTTAACEAWGEDELVVNEINTIPGFTKISMYPKLWEATGVPYPELIDRLIGLAIERHGRDRALASAVELAPARTTSTDGE